MQPAPTKSPQKLAAEVSMPTLFAYASFAAIGFVVYNTVADRESSSVLTMSALAQCLAMTMLCIQSIISGKATGISASSLMLEAAAICLRLSSTLWLDGYLPSDSSGDYVYQFFDICSLLLVAFLLRQVFVVHRSTYQDYDDNCPVGPLFMLCIGLGAVLHGDMDERPIFDSLWLAGIFSGVVAVLPQFWLITRSGGWTGPMMGHYIAAMALSRVLSGCFMWMGRVHLTCQPYFAGVQHTIIAIFIAHFVHIMLLADFAYLYMHSMVNRGMTQLIPLTSDAEMPTCTTSYENGPISYLLDDDAEESCSEQIKNALAAERGEVGVGDWYTAEPEVDGLLMAKLPAIHQIEDVELRESRLGNALMAAIYEV
jgi:hypothetical protein